MTDQETAQHLRNWVADKPLRLYDLFSWPTDACGYDQHIRFVNHRNSHWTGETAVEMEIFILDYADTLDGGKV